MAYNSLPARGSALRDEAAHRDGPAPHPSSLGHFARSVVRSLGAHATLHSLISEEEDEEAMMIGPEENDVDALPEEGADEPEVDLAQALADAMQPGGVRGARSRRASVLSMRSSSRRSSDLGSYVPPGSAARSLRSAHDSELSDGLVGDPSTAVMEALDAPHSFRSPSPSPEPVRGRADSEDADAGAAAAAAAAFTTPEAEKLKAHALFDRMMGTKAQRRAAKTREEKEAPMRAWLLAVTLGSSENGLPEACVAPRTSVFGTNHLSASKPPTWYSQLFWCFLHPFNVLLAVLAVVAASTGDINSVVLISLMVTISVGIAFVQERRALISALALSKRITHRVRVRRPLQAYAGMVHSTDNSFGASQHKGYAPVNSSAPGSERVLSTRVNFEGGEDGVNAVPFTVEEIPSHELVPGDVVTLAAGSLIPADMRLLSCSQLLINQTILTGESVPAEKYSRRYRPHDASRDGSGELAGHTDSHFLRRPNLAFMGSVVESGSGVGIVLSTGSNSYFGANASELQQARPPSAFARGVKQVSYILMGFTAIMLPIVIVVNGLIKKNWTDAALFGAAVAVGITPVMLPMIVSGNLSLAAHNLAKRKCLVKRLEAVQNLGATTVLCTDKTGTLTDDHVRLYGAVTTDGAAAPSSRAMHVAYIIAAKQEGFRNVLDRAIVEHAEESPAEQMAHAAAAARQAGGGAAGSVVINSIDSSMSVARNLQSQSARSGRQVVPQVVLDPAPVPVDFVPRPRIVLPHPHNASVAYTKVTELPFDFRRRRMSIVLDINTAVHVSPATNPNEEVVSLLPEDIKAQAMAAANTSNNTKVRMLYCKGALAEMLRGCSHYRRSESDMEVRPLDAQALEGIKELGEQLAAKGLRVLAVAEKRMEVPSVEDAKDGAASGSGSGSGAGGLPTIADESGMTLLGFLSFLDTPKASAGPALEALASLGISTKVLTGDNPLVARQVCSQLGIGTANILTGDDMARLPTQDDDPSLFPLFERTTIFSQLSPDDKARVVRVLKAGGCTIAALGDGINDALMLREADVGISVDTGADLAKEAADIILTEKDLEVLVTAVSLGRRTHGNSIKYIKMAASSNFGNCFSLLIAAAWLPFLPAGALQLLTQGLLYDISQLAIPFDRMDRDWLKKPQAWSGGNLTTFMIFIGPISSVFDVSTFAIAYWLYGLDDPNNKHGVSQFQTMWFMVGLVTQVLIVHCIRTERVPFIQSRAHPRLSIMSLIIAAIGLALPYIKPAADALNMVAPPVSFFAVIGGTCLVYALLVLIVKKIYIWKFKQWL